VPDTHNVLELIRHAVQSYPTRPALGKPIDILGYIVVDKKTDEEGKEV
jgi:hypothetical protein